MASRTDKLDAMRLSASLSNFTFVVNPGISGKNVPANALSAVSCGKVRVVKIGLLI